MDGEGRHTPLDKCKGKYYPLHTYVQNMRGEYMSKRSRSWVLTINYKETHPTTNDDVLKTILEMTGVAYTAFQLEQGEQGTNHHQIYIAFENAKTFEKIKKVFPTAHIEIAKGTPKQASDYCTKEESRIGESIIWGELPQQGKRTDMEDIYDMLKEGYTLREIRETYPSQYMRHLPRIQNVQQELLEEKFGNVFRQLHVIYLSGETGIGKTRYIMEKYGYDKVFAISNYKNPFDTYKGEDIIVFEEFRSSLPIEVMLRYLDGYPIRLQARYGDKVACYTKVYVISNWDITEQYENIQKYHPKTFEAFKRRITFCGNLELVKSYEENIENTKDKTIEQVSEEMFGDIAKIKG